LNQGWWIIEISLGIKKSYRIWTQLMVIAFFELLLKALMSIVLGMRQEVRRMIGQWIVENCSEIKKVSLRRMKILLRMG
jgi:hypothetical protein